VPAPLIWKLCAYQEGKIIKKLKYIQISSALCFIAMLVLLVISSYIQLTCGYDCRLFDTPNDMAVIGYQFLALVLGVPSLIVSIFASWKIYRGAAKYK